MGVHELCNRCYYLTTARWSLVEDDAPVDEELRDGKSFWIVEDEDDEGADVQDGQVVEGVNGAGAAGEEPLDSPNGEFYDAQEHPTVDEIVSTSPVVNKVATTNGDIKDGGSLSSQVNGHPKGHAHSQANGTINGIIPNVQINGNGAIEFDQPQPTPTVPDAFAPFSHHSLGDIISEPELNCHLCRSIYENLQQQSDKLDRYAGDDGTHLFAIPFLINESVLDPLTKTLAFYYFWDDGRNPDSVFAVYLYLKPLEDTNVAPFVDLSRSSRSETIAAIWPWLRECSTTHTKCNELRNKLAAELPTPGLPARLLQITKQNLRPFVRLVDSSSLQPDTQYATLSHCWGKHARLKLSTANQRDLYQRVQYAALPQVFADAVRVTMDLGLSYLWIDALCIIQDSEEDWQAESASMAWVYSQAHVNIAATASKEGRDTLFCQKDELLANSLVLDTTWSGSDLEGKAWLCFDETRWHKYVTQAPLNQRAWVLQERLLAPRTIHFAKDQVWWTCRSAQRCESLPPSLSTAPISGGLADQLARGNWEAIVEAYTAFALTYPRDRLIAISGLAWAYQVTHKLPPGQYIAGLWAPNLQQQLLWKTRGASTAAAKYRAPSWSWASIDGAVEWDAAAAASSKKIWFAWGMRSWFEGNADAFGPVVRASLRVDCMIYPVTVTRLGTRYAGGGHAHSHQISSNNISPGAETPAHARAANSPYVVRSDSERFGAKKAAWGGLARVSPDDDAFFDTGADATPTYFLPICIVDAMHRNHGQYPIVSGLLIKPVAGGERGAYRRVGKLDMTYYRSPNVWTLYKEWMAGETLKPLAYLKDHGGCRYDIVLE